MSPIFRNSLIFIHLLLNMNTLPGQQAPAMVESVSAEEKVMQDNDQRIYYEIFIRSFYDSNGDGIGDLNGITMKLDYMAELGIGGIWITPFHPAPSYHKYDVMDYFAVDPQYGTLADFRNLVAEAHQRNIKVLLDLVVNHTSSRHPWFAASLKDDPLFRNFYVWSGDTTINRSPGWYAPPPGSGGPTGERYYGFFWKGMPDLNFDNQEVRNQVIEIGKWWLRETGVDGFRLDAAQHLYEADDPEENVEWWTEFSAGIKEENPEAITIGECWNRYYHVGQYLEGLTGCFNFELSWDLLKCLQQERNTNLIEKLVVIRAYYDDYAPYYLDPVFLSNHDGNRILSDLGGNLKKGKLAAAIYMTLPGTPFIYYGEELGMLGMKPDSLIREPFPWNAAGIDKGQTKWESPVYSVEKAVPTLFAQQHDSASMYRHYKELIQLRKSTPELTSRNLEAVKMENKSLIAFLRKNGDDEMLVIHNLSSNTFDVHLPENMHDFKSITYNHQSNRFGDHGNLIMAGYGSLILKKQ